MAEASVVVCALTEDVRVRLKAQRQFRARDSIVGVDAGLLGLRTIQVERECDLDDWQRKRNCCYYSRSSLRDDRAVDTIANFLYMYLTLFLGLADSRLEHSVATGPRHPCEDRNSHAT